MTDHYTNLRIAVQRRPEIGAQERRSIYAAAREALIGELRQIDPPPDGTVVALERKEFEKAVFRLEYEFVSPPRHGKANGSSPASPAEAVPSPAPPPPCATGIAVEREEAAERKENTAKPVSPPAPLPAFVWPPRRPDPPAAPVLAASSAPRQPPATTPTSKSPSPHAAEWESLMSRLDEMKDILRKLQSDTPGVEASALISGDGRVMASALSTDVDEARVAGMTATLLGLGARASTALGRGAVKEIILHGDDGYASVVDAGRGVMLLTLANGSTKLGSMFSDLNQAAHALKGVL